MKVLRRHTLATGGRAACAPSTVWHRTSCAKNRERDHNLDRLEPIGQTLCSAHTSCRHATTMQFNLTCARLASIIDAKAVWAGVYAGAIVQVHERRTLVTARCVARAKGTVCHRTSCAKVSTRLKLQNPTPHKIKRIL